MGHKINERNIGSSKLDSSPKKGAKRLTASEAELASAILEKVYESMKESSDDGKWYDEGNFVLSLNGEQMYDLFEAKRKLKNG